MDKFHFATRQHGSRDAGVALPRRRLAVAIAAAFATQLAFAAPPAPNTLPAGGQVAAGRASIQQSGANMAVNQTSNSAILNWQSFSIGANAAVNFVQPTAGSVTLNRVLGSDPSAIYGSLTANGQVFLVNPSGVMFGPGARVDVGGLVASTLNIRDSDFLSGIFRFTRDGAVGAVVNQGDLSGKYVALLAPEVRNEGVISARMGTVALAAGDAVTLGITGQSLVDVRVDRASINTLVENRRLVVAEEGTVILSAQSANSLLGRAVNSGVIEANGISSQGGTVRLLASSDVENAGSISADGARNGSGGSVTLIAGLDNPASRTLVSGSLSARGGADSGDGGFIETSASRLSIADSARIDAGAANGRSGLWLLDPEDFTIALSGGDITGAALGLALATNDVTIQTGTGTNTATSFFGTTGTNGDILVNASVTWASAKQLTMQAHRNIVVNSEINVNGGGTLLLNFGTGGPGDYLVRAPINLSATAVFKTQDGSNTPESYTVIRDDTALAAVGSGLAGNYVLGTDVTSTINPWVPIGNSVTPFTGVFDGLGHVVKDVTRPNTDNATTGIGLFGQSDGMIRNLGVTNVNVAGSVNVGGLAGINSGLISNSYSTGTVTGSDVAAPGADVGSIGGLVGRNDGNISGSYSSATVTATSGNQGAGGTMNFTQGGIGGLVGASNSPITDSYATGAVTGISDVGGLVGYSLGVISTSYSTGLVTGTNNAGGLLGFSSFFAPGLLQDTFWNTVSSGLGTSANSPGDPFGFPIPIPPSSSTGLDDTQIKAAGSFTGFDFTNTWVIREGTSTPLLRGMLPPLFIAPTAQNKVYDGAIFGGANAVTFSTPVGAKTGGAAVFGGAAATAVNAGLHAITVSGITLASDTDQHGFLSITPLDGILTITPKPVNLTAPVSTKVYDGIATIAANAGDLTTLSTALGVGGETVTGITLTYDTANAGTGKTLTPSAAVVSSGAGNYDITFVTNNTSEITPKPVNQTAPVRTKVFDGIATIAPTAGNLAALSAELGVAGDTVTGITLTYDTAVVGTGKTLTPSASVISSGAGNYAITFVPNATSAITGAAPTTPATTTTTSNDEPAARVVREADKKGNEEQERNEFRERTQAFGGDTTRLASFVSSHPDIPGTTRLVGYPVRVSAQSGRDWQLLVGEEPPAVRVGSSTFSVMLPDSTFSHTRRDAVVTLSATQSDGKPLPEWLKFNPKTGTFSGNAPSGFKDKVAVKVNASDNQGQQASVDMTLNFGS